MAHALLQMVEIEYNLCRNAGEHDPADLWWHLKQVGAIEMWQELHSDESCTLAPHGLQKSSMFALRNCLRAFHAEPCMPVDVRLDELRYTRCTIKPVFSHGPHARQPLQQPQLGGYHCAGIRGPLCLTHCAGPPRYSLWVPGGGGKIIRDEQQPRFSSWILLIHNGIGKPLLHSEHLMRWPLAGRRRECGGNCRDAVQNQSHG